MNPADTERAQGFVLLDDRDHASARLERAPLGGAPPLSRARRTHHRFFLVASAAALVAGLLLDVRGGRIVLPLAGAPLPGSCLSNQVLGFPCPGCGLTRSVVSALHGQLAEAIAFHRLGLVLLAAIAAQLPLRAWILWARARDLAGWPDRAARAAGILIIVALLANWAVERLAHL